MNMSAKFFNPFQGLLAAIILTIIYISCTQSNDPLSANTLKIGDTLTVNFRDTLYNQQENTWITFNALAADSRCPLDVVCVWEGNAEVNIIFSKDNAHASFNLNTFPDFSNDTTVFNYSVALVDVLPYPHSDSLYSANQYSVKILLNKGN